MTEYGEYIKNNKSETQIDSNWRNMSFIEDGFLTIDDSGTIYDGALTFTDNDSKPLLLAWKPDTAGVSTRDKYNIQNIYPRKYAGASPGIDYMTVDSKGQIYIISDQSSSYGMRIAVKPNYESVFTGMGSYGAWSALGTSYDKVDVYAFLYNSGTGVSTLYKRTGGAGSFASTGETITGMVMGFTGAPNGDLYCCVNSGDIYRKPSGGSWTALGETSRAWRGMGADDDGNIYACVPSPTTGDIYKRTGGSGSFNAMGETARNWYGIDSDSDGNIYACVYSGATAGDGYVYKQTGGSGSFTALTSDPMNWHSLAVDPDDRVHVAYDYYVHIAEEDSSDFKLLMWPAITTGAYFIGSEDDDQTIDWLLYKVTLDLTDDGHGMIVLNDKYEPVFDSNKEYLKIREVHEIGLDDPDFALGEVNSEDISHPDISDPYYILITTNYASMRWSDVSSNLYIVHKLVGIQKLTSTSVRVTWFDKQSWIYGGTVADEYLTLINNTVILVVCEK